MSQDSATRPTQFIVSCVLLEIEKRNLVKLMRDEVYRVRHAAVDLVKQGYVTYPKLEILRLDDTPLTLNIKGLELEVLAFLRPHQLVGHTEQTFYAYYNSIELTRPRERNRLYWFPSKKTRDQFVAAYGDNLAIAVKRADITAFKLREAVKGY